MVAMRSVVLKNKMLQVTDVAKENQEPMADQVITMEPELNLSFCRVLFTFNKYSLYLASLVICIHETVGLWGLDMVIPFCVGVKFGVLSQEKKTD
jgi:hypothetical protein